MSTDESAREIPRESECSSVRVRSNFRVDVYDVPDDESWRALPRPERRRRLAATAPVETMRMANTSCVALHEYLPTLLNFRNDLQEAADHPDAVVFGSDGTTQPATSDRSLNAPVGNITLTDPSAEGTEWRADEFLSSLELNDENLREIGVESESGALFNHALMANPQEPKTINTAMNIAIAIGFGAP